MLKELYVKLPTDNNYERRLECDGEGIQSIIQQVRMVLGTKPGQVLGAPNFGIDLQQYLFSYNTNPDEIKFMVNAAIGYYIKFDPKRYQVGCEINFGHDTNGDEYGIIDVYINSVPYMGILVSQQ